MSFSLSECRQIHVSHSAHWKTIQRYPDLLAGFKGAALWQDGEKKGKGKNGGKNKGESAMVVRGRNAPWSCRHLLSYNITCMRVCRVMVFYCLTECLFFSYVFMVD